MVGCFYFAGSLLCCMSGIKIQEAKIRKLTKNEKSFLISSSHYSPLSNTPHIQEIKLKSLLCCTLIFESNNEAHVKNVKIAIQMTVTQTN